MFTCYIELTEKLLVKQGFFCFFLLMITKLKFYSFVCCPANWFQNTFFIFGLLFIDVFESHSSDRKFGSLI